METYLKSSCILPNTYEYFYFQFSIGNMYIRKKQKFCTELFSFIGALTTAVWQLENAKETTIIF